ncbi:MAG TPA: hypothetical protein VFR68_09890 [Candidatus Dormibacteraeota bacterium]|nr:hypothetical protein [Candidatus Dormibacteraeota bacterium]
MTNQVVSWILAPFQFLYNFIVGDDWTVAVAVFAGLAVTAFLNANHIVAWWLMPIIAIAMTGISIRRLHPRG